MYVGAAGVSVAAAVREAKAATRELNPIKARLRAFADALPGKKPDAVPFVQLAARGTWGPPLRERAAVG